jgi:deoxyribodipyrimidine photo-lyase
VIGKDYPSPIVDIEATRKIASDQVWGFKKTTAVKTEGSRILSKHVNTSGRRTSTRKTK